MPPRETRARALFRLAGCSLLVALVLAVAGIVAWTFSAGLSHALLRHSGPVRRIERLRASVQRSEDLESLERYLGPGYLQAGVRALNGIFSKLWLLGELTEIERVLAKNQSLLSKDDVVMLASFVLRQTRKLPLAVASFEDDVMFRVLRSGFKPLPPFRSDGWEILELDGKTKSAQSGNDLTLFSCAKDMFASLEASIRKAESFIYIKGWDFNPNLTLTRPGRQTIGELLKAKAARGTDVRVRLWADALVFPDWLWYVPLWVIK